MKENKCVRVDDKHYCTNVGEKCKYFERGGFHLPHTNKFPKVPIWNCIHEYANEAVLCGCAEAMLDAAMDAI